MTTNLPRDLSNPDNTSNHSPLLGAILTIGKPFGLRWVPEQYLRVIYRNSRYAGVRTPNKMGIIRFNQLTETLGPLVFIGGNPANYVFEGLVTRDVLPVKVTLYSLISFDPREISKDIARVLVQYSKDLYVGIAQTYYRWVLAALVNKYDAADLTVQENKELVETELQTRVTKEMSFIGIKPVARPRILGIELPQTLKERYEIISQRRANILAGMEFHPAEFRRELITEVIESIGQAGTGDSFLNFPQLLETYAVEHPQTMRTINPPEKPDEPKKPTDEPGTPKRLKSRLDD